MKKILLTVFLLSFSSHALAKVEIWLCNSRYGIDVFKIDTNWPLNTAQRLNSHWKKLWVAEKKSEVEDIIYDSSYKQLRVIYNPGKEKKEMIFLQSSIEKGQMIGRGQFGVVFKGKISLGNAVYVFIFLSRCINFKK